MIFSKGPVWFCDADLKLWNVMQSFASPWIVVLRWSNALSICHKYKFKLFKQTHKKKVEKKESIIFLLKYNVHIFFSVKMIWICGFDHTRIILWGFVIFFFKEICVIKFSNVPIKFVMYDNSKFEDTLWHTFPNTFRSIWLKCVRSCVVSIIHNCFDHYCIFCLLLGEC